MALNSTLDQIDLMNVYRTFHPKAAEYTFFSITHGTFFSIDHMLGHKTSLNKFKKIEISSIFSDHNSMRLEINYKKKTKNHKHVESKHMLLSNQWIIAVMNLEIKIYLETNENGSTTFQNIWDSAKAVLRGKFIAI